MPLKVNLRLAQVDIIIAEVLRTGREEGALESAPSLHGRNAFSRHRMKYMNTRMPRPALQPALYCAS